MFYRFQYGHYTLAEMQDYVSEDGGDDLGEVGGICACESPDDLFRNTVWINDDRFDAEVVIFKGQIETDIYDGVRVYPTEIVEYCKPSEFVKKYSS